MFWGGEVEQVDESSVTAGMGIATAGFCMIHKWYLMLTVVRLVLQYALAVSARAIYPDLAEQELDHARAKLLSLLFWLDVCSSILRDWTEVGDKFCLYSAVFPRTYLGNIQDTSGCQTARVLDRTLATQPPTARLAPRLDCDWHCASAWADQLPLQLRALIKVTILLMVFLLAINLTESMQLESSGTSQNNFNHPLGL